MTTLILIAIYKLTQKFYRKFFLKNTDNEFYKQKILENTVSNIIKFSGIIKVYLTFLLISMS